MKAVLTGSAERLEVIKMIQPKELGLSSRKDEVPFPKNPVVSGTQEQNS